MQLANSFFNVAKMREVWYNKFTENPEFAERCVKLILWMKLP